MASGVTASLGDRDAVPGGDQVAVAGALRAAGVGCRATLAAGPGMLPLCAHLGAVALRAVETWVVADSPAAAA
jgi:hypothetical protein